LEQMPVLYPGVELILVNPMGLNQLKGVKKINLGKQPRTLFTPPPGTPPLAPTPGVRPDAVTRRLM
jgi:hypothetical protein